MLNEFEEQVKDANEQMTGKSPLDYLRQSILSESNLQNIEIETPKKYLGPISEGTIGEIYGLRGIGKSFLMDVISLCLTRQISLGPFKCENPAGVLIIDAEMPIYLIKNRHKELSQNVGPAVKSLDFIANERLYKSGSSPINLSDAVWRESLLELIKSEKDRWDVIIMDNLSSLLPGIKENDKDAWGPINQFLLQLRWMGKSANFIHHAGKNGDQRGTSSREDQLDYVLKLTLPTGHDPENGCRFDATLTKSRSLTGVEVQPFTFEIIPHPNGGLTWNISSQREKRKEIIIALLGNGATQKDIAAIMAVGKSYVSQICKYAIDHGLLNTNGTSFTPAGQLKYGEIDIEKYFN